MIKYLFWLKEYEENDFFVFHFDFWLLVFDINSYTISFTLIFVPQEVWRLIGCASICYYSLLIMKCVAFLFEKLLMSLFAIKCLFLRQFLVRHCIYSLLSILYKLYLFIFPNNVFWGFSATPSAVQNAQRAIHNNHNFLLRTLQTNSGVIKK